MTFAPAGLLPAPRSRVDSSKAVAMPVPTEKLYPPARLHYWFAGGSLFMTLSFFWLIAVDYDRPWRGYQDHYYLGKAALAHLDFLDTQR